MTTTQMEQMSVDQLKQEGHKVTTASNWTFGEIASRLVAEHNWTDQQVADEFGKSQPSVNFARRIFERFYSRGNKVSFVWREWKQIIAWSDADKCLDWAEEMEATFAEMAAWRRAQNGEDIKAAPKPTAAANLTADDLPETEKKEQRQEPVARPQSTTRHTEANRKTPEAEKSKTQPVQPAQSPPQRDAVKDAIEDFLNQQSAKWFFDEAIKRDPRLKPKVPTAPQLIAQIPDRFSPELKAKAELWVTHKQSLEGKARIRSFVAWDEALQQMESLPESVVIAAMGQAMTNGWQGWLQDSVKKQTRETGAVRNQDVDNFVF